MRKTAIAVLAVTSLSASANGFFRHSPPDRARPCEITVQFAPGDPQNVVVRPAVGACDGGNKIALAKALLNYAVNDATVEPAPTPEPQ